MTTPFAFPLPWSVVNYDGRISIIDASSAHVTEVYPGQHLGQIPKTETCLAVARRIVNAVNLG
jgi:hypothetical protein